MYPRPNGKSTLYNSMAINGNRTTEMLKTVEATVAAVGAALPQLSSVVQEYKTADRFQEDVVCAGTIQKIGDSYGVLMNDTKAGESGLFAISGRWLCQLEGSATVTVGGDVYIASSDMLVSHDATSREYLGSFHKAATNPNGLEAGSFAWVNFNQTEK